MSVTHHCTACLNKTIEGANVVNPPLVLSDSTCTAPGGGCHRWTRISQVAAAQTDPKLLLYSNYLKNVGVESGRDQYFIYGSILVSVVASFKPLRKAYYFNKWMQETDDHLKRRWAGKGSLLQSEMDAGRDYLKDLRRVPKRWLALPLTVTAYVGGNIWKRIRSKSLSK